jgi:hypothetical protein
MLNGIPETLMIFFGPIIFGIVSAIVLLCDNIYLIYLWFANMGWFFKTNTNYSASGGPKWEDTTWVTPINYCIAIWLVIIFGLGFLFTMPVFFFLSFLLMGWLILSSLSFKAEMNGKIFSLGTLILDIFKYNKISILSVFILFIISSAFSKLGTASGIFSIITLGLIYFGIISIDLFNPVINNNMTPIVSFEQAAKTCKFKRAPVLSSPLNFFKGGSISKEIKAAGKILSKNNT